jgi:hypothetical protein
MTLEQCEPSEQSDNSKLWDALAKQAGCERDACKFVIFAILMGEDVIGAVTKNGLSINQVTDIRMAFDDCSAKIGAGMPL